MELMTLRRAYFTLFMNGYISVKLLKDDLSISEKDAEEVIKELTSKGAISGFDFAKGEMLLVTEKELDELLKKVKSDEVKEKIKKDFCIYNDNISIHTLEPVSAVGIEPELIEKARALKEQYGKLTVALVQTKLGIGFNKAYRIKNIVEGEDKTWTNQN